MPHLIVLYSANLESETDMSALCRRLADAMLTVQDEQRQQVFPTGGVRVFAYPASHYAVADGQRDYAFVYLNLRMGRGRAAAIKQHAGETLLAAAKAHFEPLFADTFFESGADIPIERFIAPRVEVELAFVLDKALRGPAVTLTDVLAATAYVTPALEIIDARIEQFDRDTRAPRRVFDTIADFAANAGIVPGGQRAPPEALDLRWVGALLYKNEVIEETGLAAGVLDHPANGVAWLANKIARYDEQLNPGDIVLSGSFTRPTTVKRGDVLRADFSSLGTISVRFV